MTWLLRLFPQYRALEAQLAETAASRIKLQDNERWFQGQIDELTRQTTEYRDKALKGAYTVTDFLSQYTFGRKIYDVGPDLPAREESPEPISSDAVQARDVVEELNSEKALAELIDGELKDLGVSK